MDTIAKMVLVYDTIPYPYEYNFGEGYSEEAAHYMFEEGNYSCDCNRSMFLISKYGGFINELDCGHTIELKDFEIIYKP